MISQTENIDASEKVMDRKSLPVGEVIVNEVDSNGSRTFLLNEYQITDLFTDRIWKDPQSKKVIFEGGSAIYFHSGLDREEVGVEIQSKYETEDLSNIFYKGDLFHLEYLKTTKPFRKKQGFSIRKGIVGDSQILKELNIQKMRLMAVVMFSCGILALIVHDSVDKSVKVVVDRKTENPSNAIEVITIFKRQFMVDFIASNKFYNPEYLTLDKREFLFGHWYISTRKKTKVLKVFGSIRGLRLHIPFTRRSQKYYLLTKGKDTFVMLDGNSDRLLAIRKFFPFPKLYVNANYSKRFFCFDSRHDRILLRNMITAQENFHHIPKELLHKDPIRKTIGFYGNNDKLFYFVENYQEHASIFCLNEEGEAVQHWQRRSFFSAQPIFLSVNRTVILFKRVGEHSDKRTFIVEVYENGKFHNSFEIPWTKIGANKEFSNFSDILDTQVLDDQSFIVYYSKSSPALFVNAITGQCSLIYLDIGTQGYKMISRDQHLIILVDNDFGPIQMQIYDLIKEKTVSTKEIDLNSYVKGSSKLIYFNYLMGSPYLFLTLFQGLGTRSLTIVWLLDEDRGLAIEDGFLEDVVVFDNGNANERYCLYGIMTYDTSYVQASVNRINAKHEIESVNLWKHSEDTPCIVRGSLKILPSQNLLVICITLTNKTELTIRKLDEPEGITLTYVFPEYLVLACHKFLTSNDKEIIPEKSDAKDENIHTKEKLLLQGQERFLWLSITKNGDKFTLNN
eukprot:TRINITY_DN7777_c0_g2_i2.p1 TRINITY_DN7777_c0_g2~~TRINITY_DN7777_c0_g2_i2.p1  ORF type:complete len:734 (+),score=80.65 TRINITY_DN7777_c0_g2_i2:122-2323(+)